MAWTYSDFESQTTDSARLTRLRLHISEVRAEFGPSMSIDQRRRDNAPLNEYLSQLYERMAELEAVAETVASDDARLSAFTRGRPV